MLTDLDWLGPNLNGKKHDDPEAEGPSCDAIPWSQHQVPQEKGYVWFTVEETIAAPATSGSSIGKAAGDSNTDFQSTLSTREVPKVRIKLLDEGIIPAWLDLHYLQVFAGQELRSRIWPPFVTKKMT